MTDRCEPPPGLRDRDGWHYVAAPNNSEKPWLWESRFQSWASYVPHPADAAERGWRYLSPVLTPAEVAALRAENARLREALEDLMDVQQYATGWDNGVTDSTGHINEGAHFHAMAMDRARAALVQENKA